jgi:hypothetical protein
MTTVIYPFRLRNARTGKWYRARWKAPMDEIAKLGGVVDGPAEVHEHLGATSGFQAYRPPVAAAESLAFDPCRVVPDQLCDDERFLARLFLRRYVTYCARRDLRARAAGAAALWREL